MFLELFSSLLLFGFQIYVVSHRFRHQFFRRLLRRFRAITIATHFTTIISRLCSDATLRRRRRCRRRFLRLLRRGVHRRFPPLQFFFPLSSHHILRHSSSLLVLLLPNVHDILPTRRPHRTRRQIRVPSHPLFLLLHFFLAFASNELCEKRSYYSRDAQRGEGHKQRTRKVIVVIVPTITVVTASVTSAAPPITGGWFIPWRWRRRGVF